MCSRWWCSEAKSICAAPPERPHYEGKHAGVHEHKQHQVDIAALQVKTALHILFALSTNEAIKRIFTSPSIIFVINIFTLLVEK